MQTTITLLSDLWFKEEIINTIYYLCRTKNYQVFDISHKVQHKNLEMASYILEPCINIYDKNTWHICLVGIQECEDECLIVSEMENCFVISVNNGFANMLNPSAQKKQWAINFKNTKNELNHLTFIQKALEVIEHYAEPDYLESVVVNTKIIKKNLLQPSIRENHIQGKIIYINPNQSIVVNIKREKFYEVCNGRNFSYSFLINERIEKVSNNISEVNADEAYMLFNENGYLEIGIKNNNFIIMLLTKHRDEGKDFPLMPGQAMSSYMFATYLENIATKNPIDIKFEGIVNP